MILHVVASGGLYGIERMLASLLPTLRQAGHPVELLCLGARGSSAGQVGELLESFGIPVRYLPVGRGIRPRDLSSIWKALRGMRPSVIHLHGYKASILVGSIALLRRIPAMSTSHSESLQAPEVTRQLRLEALVLKRLPVVAAVSTGVAADLSRRGVRASKIRVIANGIMDLAPADLAPPRVPARRLAVMGRLIHTKNVHLLIEAVARLVQTYPDIRLVVAGSGPAGPMLESLVGTLGVENHVHFTGFVVDVGLILRDCDVFVMPSASEGMPIALLEAMAFGRIIVATAVGGIPSIVENGIHAMLIPPGDVDALADALIHVLSHGDRAIQMASAARRRFEAAFVARQMAAAYAAEYAALTRHKSAFHNFLR